MSNPYDPLSRTIVKSFSWLLFFSPVSVLVTYLVSQSWNTALWVGGVEAVLKFLFFVGHERLWLRFGVGNHPRKPAVVWFTGLSGSGKTTVAKALCERLEQMSCNVEWLDGDVTRKILPQTGFSKAERDGHVIRSGFLAQMLERKGIFVVASYISPYNDARSKVREMCDRFMEVYLSTPLEECERRDVKGLYAKARSGEITQFTGIDDPYEAPLNPELTIDTTHCTPEQAVDKILQHLKLN